MSLWAILAAPLILGNDLTAMDAQAQAILSAPEVVAVDQDTLGLQGHRITSDSTSEVWTKQMADGSVIVGLFNRGLTASFISVNFSDIGKPAISHIRDLWAELNLGAFATTFNITVPAHGVALVRIQ